MLEALRSALALPRGGRRLAAVERLALEWFARFGLSGWSYGFNRRKRSLGVCFYRRRAVELSVYLVERNGPEERYLGLKLFPDLLVPQLQPIQRVDIEDLGHGAMIDRLVI